MYCSISLRTGVCGYTDLHDGHKSEARSLPSWMATSCQVTQDIQWSKSTDLLNFAQTLGALSCISYLELQENTNVGCKNVFFLPSFISRRLFRAIKISGGIFINNECQPQTI
jgi:hypothetical protein